MGSIVHAWPKHDVFSRKNLPELLLLLLQSERQGVSLQNPALECGCGRKRQLDLIQIAINQGAKPFGGDFMCFAKQSQS
jgi:hypothetical protein